MWPSAGWRRTGPIRMRATPMTRTARRRRGAIRCKRIRPLVEMLERDADADEFLENAKLEMFQDQVFTFSPKGDLIALPRGATPIDFAYAVHTDVG